MKLPEPPVPEHWVELHNYIRDYGIACARAALEAAAEECDVVSAWAPHGGITAVACAKLIRALEIET